MISAMLLTVSTNKEANAVDCSRLAWLFLNLQNEPAALKYARMGLEKDNSNQHCQNLVDKLSM